MLRLCATAGGFPQRWRRRPLAWLAATIVVLAAVAVGAAGAAAAAAADRGVVDITTRLGYQGGAAAGTGMVLTASGELLTNNHVIRGATSVRVTDPATGRSYPATVVSYDLSADVAVLKVKGAPGLTPITVGDASTVKLGDRVTAVGNAGGLGGAPASATGRVTGLHRSIVASDGQGNAQRLTGMIETDAALQPGDSGGPLLNEAGQTIGMITTGSSGSEFRPARDGGTAIQINRVIAIANQIMMGRSSATVHVGATAFLGVSVSSPDSYLARADGALVVAVVPTSPAEHAGLVPGSVITSLNGRTITSYHALSTLLLHVSAGAAARIGWVDQSGNRHTASVHTTSGPPQ